MGEATSQRSPVKVKSLLLVVSSNVLVASTTWILSQSRNWAPKTLDYASGGASIIAVDVDVAVDAKQHIEVLELLEYVPSRIESFFVEHGVELGLDVEAWNTSGCTEWSKTTSPIAADLASFKAELNDYNKKMNAFPGTVKDLREHITANNHSICDTVMLHPQGLRGIFPSGSLTQTSNGLVEPIVPPMRHPDFCTNRGLLTSLEYLVHDFEFYCRKLKQSSRIILIDMGAALDFHRSKATPAIYLTHIYQRFGFHFDHIYAYELRAKEPKKVFEQVPSDLFAAYHWINVGVSPELNSTQNPWKMLLENYNEDDFVVVKLDIDHAPTEMPLAHQLMENPKLLKMVDAFYFEHHVHLKEVSGYWGKSMTGSLQDSIKLFTDLRRLGVNSHSWV